jgi:hypothetical protein
MLLSCRRHLSVLGEICEDHSNSKIKERNWICKDTRSMPNGHRESIRCLASSVCHCSWPSLFLGQKIPQQHYDMLCYLHKDERDLKLEFFYDNVGSEWSHKGTPITFKHFLRRIGKLKTPPRILSSTMISSTPFFYGDYGGLTSAWTYIKPHQVQLHGGITEWEVYQRGKYKGSGKIKMITPRK